MKDVRMEAWKRKRGVMREKKGGFFPSLILPFFSTSLGPFLPSINGLNLGRIGGKRLNLRSDYGKSTFIRVDAARGVLISRGRKWGAPFRPRNLRKMSKKTAEIREPLPRRRPFVRKAGIFPGRDTRPTSGTPGCHNLFSDRLRFPRFVQFSIEDV